MAHRYRVVKSAICKTCGEKDFFSESCRDSGCGKTQTRVRECRCARRHRKHIAKVMKGK
jgi:hypothetical protein